MGGPGRRALLLAMAGLAGAVRGQALPSALPLARDLPAEAMLAARRDQALTVLVSLHGCIYCERVRRSHLLPLLAQGQPVVQLDMNSSAPVRNFQQKALTHDEQIRQWQIKVAPTLLFFGPGGRELAPRMEGSYQPDFYGAYLEERLASAAEQLMRAKPASRP